jgi:hypothetical protein
LKREPDRPKKVNKRPSWAKAVFLDKAIFLLEQERTQQSDGKRKQ